MSKVMKNSSKSSGVKKVTVSDRFYEILTEDQIIDIVNDLNFKRQIKLKYTYFDEGATSWNDIYFTSPITSMIEELKPMILSDILYYAKENHSINLIDIGPGNAYPVKPWLEELRSMNILNKYVSVDISNDINDLVEKNVRDWFGSEMGFAKYKRDVEHDEVSRILIENKMGAEVESEEIANVTIHFGNTMCNHDDRVEVLKNLTRSMDTNDLLAFSYTTDSENNKISHGYVRNSAGDIRHGLIANMLGLGFTGGEVETTYSAEINARVKYLILDSDYEVSFKLFGGTRTVRLKKGEKIHVWRHYLINETVLQKELAEVGLEQVCLQYDKTKSLAICICRVKDHYNQR